MSPNILKYILCPRSLCIIHDHSSFKIIHSFNIIHSFKIFIIQVYTTFIFQASFKDISHSRSFSQYSSYLCHVLYQSCIKKEINTSPESTSADLSYPIRRIPQPHIYPPHSLRQPLVRSHVTNYSYSYCLSSRPGQYIALAKRWDNQ